MSRWCTLTLLLCLAVPTMGRAQMAYPPVYPDGTNGVVPAGWHAESPYAGYHGKSHVRTYGPTGPLAYGPGRTVYEELPDDQGWLYDDTPLERILKETFRHAYFRLEYLLWDIGDPGNNRLGAPSNFPGSEFTVVQTTNNGAPIVGYQQSLAGVYTNENNGIRATFGLPVFNAGTFEASIFALQTSRAELGFPDLRLVDIDGDGVVDLDGRTLVDTTRVDSSGNIIQVEVSQNVIDAVIQGLLVDGQIPAGAQFLVNDIDYQAALKTSVWGTEGNFVFAPYNPNDDLLTMPFLGFRYLNFSEDLRQAGVYTFTTFDPLTGTQSTEIATRKIDSTTINNLYGPQIGLKAEIRRKWFAIGATPKVMLGLNTYRATVDTRQVLGPDDPPTSLYKKTTTFGVIGDIEVYSRVYLTDHLSLSVGYNFLWAGMLTRPADNLVYNIQRATAATPSQSAFGLEPKFSGAILQGINIGGQIEY